MNKPVHMGRGKKREAGYALLMVIFLLSLLVLASVAVAPNVLTSGKREKEKELIWRGNQYARGVRLYYQKRHRFPTSLDDLTEPKTGIRFMRQAYKDPMNRTDGSWRLIYVGPNGQLIGSLKNRSLTISGIGASGANASPLANSPLAPSTGMSSFSPSGAGGNALGGSSFGNSSFGNSSFGNPPAAGTNPGAAPPGGAQLPGATTTGDASNPNASGEMGVPHDLATPDSSTVIGGNIIGVGSKIDEKSIIWYDKAKNYQLFEFIWDPSKDMMVGAASRGIGTPVQNLGGNNPTGLGLSGTNPTQTPQQNPNLNPNPNPDPTPPLQAPPNP